MPKPKKYTIKPGTPSLVFTGQVNFWEDYETEELLTFDRGDIGRTTITFNYLGTWIQFKREHVVIR